MSSSSSDEPKNKEKFTMRDALLYYPRLKAYPDEVRVLASTFLPVPGFPPPTISNADEAVFVTYQPEVANVSQTVPLGPKKALYPLGAIYEMDQKHEGRDVEGLVHHLINYLCEDEVFKAHDGKCYGCRNEVARANLDYFCWKSANKENKLTTRITYFFCCKNNPGCSFRIAQKVASYDSPQFYGKLTKFNCHHCLRCESKPGEFKCCPKCKITFYCSKTCQRADWKEHKKVCKEIVVCNNCGKTEDSTSGAGSYMKCARCLSSTYCSKECQIKHWKTHKKNCSSQASETKQKPSKREV